MDCTSNKFPKNCNYILDDDDKKICGDLLSQGKFDIFLGPENGNYEFNIEIAGFRLIGENGLKIDFDQLNVDAKISSPLNVNQTERDRFPRFKSFATIFLRLVHQFNYVDSSLVEDAKKTFHFLRLFSFDKIENGVDTPELSDEVFPEFRNEINDYESRMALLNGSILLLLFVNDNFTGPRLRSSHHSWTENLVLDLCKEKIVARNLQIDSVDIYHLVRNPWIFYLVGQYFHYLMANDQTKRPTHESDDVKLQLWWSRYLMIYLSILLDPVETLLTKLKKAQEKLLEFYSHTDNHSNKADIVAILCELSQGSILRDDILFCRRALDLASSLSGIEIEATGVMGRRTKFQGKLVPQLVIKISGQSGEKSEVEHATIEIQSSLSKLPEEVGLDCDTLLPEIELVDDYDGHTNYVNRGENLSDENSELLLLCTLNFATKCEAVDEDIAAEFSLAYLRTVIKSCKIWCVKYKALILRCQFEAKTIRKSNRALLQMENLSKLSSENYDELKISPGDGDSIQPLVWAHSRMKSFFSVMPASCWQVQSNLGDICMNLCLYKNALDIFLPIENWPQIINCYKILEMNQKAEEIILQELSKYDNSPYLYCLLGDIRESVEMYEKAWKISQCRYARAQKSLGTYHYVRKDYAKACKHYELALSVNPTNMEVLTMISYANLLLENYEDAAHYYRLITEIDDSSFLVWNNLSKAYIKLKQKKRAHYTLQQAIKCNYDEWKLWENFQLVSIDVHAFNDVIKSWHRLIDLKQRHSDDRVLESLTVAIEKNLLDSVTEKSARIYLKQALELCERIRSTTSPSQSTFMCHLRILLVKLSCSENPQADEDKLFLKISDILGRCITMRHPNPTWFKVPQSTIDSLKSYQKLLAICDYIFEIAPNLFQCQQFKIQIQKIRMNLKSSLSLLRSYIDCPEDCQTDDTKAINNLYHELSKKIDSLVNLCSTSIE